MSRLERIGKGVAIAAVGLFGINLIPHFKPKISHKIYKYENAEVPEQLVEHVKKIARAMDLKHSDNIDVFIDKGFTAVSGGHTMLPNGATIGLPRTFLFESPRDVMDSGVRLQGNAIDWNSQSGEAIKEILVPSGDHMNFVIAHEVAHIKKKDFLLISSLSPVTLLVSYYTARVLPKALFPRYTTPAVPAVFVVCILIYFHVQSSLGRWLEFRADRVAAQSHPRYREGGIEYMKKNILLQSYLEPMGKSPSTMNPLTSKHPTFQERLQRLQAMERVQ